MAMAYDHAIAEKRRIRTPRPPSPNIACDGWIEGAAGVSPAFADPPSASPPLYKALDGGLLRDLKSPEPPKSITPSRTFFWVALPSSWAIVQRRWFAVVRGTTSSSAPASSPRRPGLPLPLTHSPLS